MNPLTYVTIEAWSRLTHRAPSALEIEALLALDGVMRRPNAEKAEP